MRALALVLLLPFLASIVSAGTFGGDDELQKRIAARRPAINKLKSAGKVGEVWDGYVETVKSSYKDDEVESDGKKTTVAKLLEAENDDRKKVYEIIAKKQKTSVTAVARVRGDKEFETAVAGEWLKSKDDGWFQKKKDEPKK